MKPIIAITMGDPAGIGPEIVARSLSIKDTYQRCRPLVIGDAQVMNESVRLLHSPVTIHAIEHVDEARFDYGTIDVLDMKCIDMKHFKPGEIQAQCGNAAFVSVRKAIELAMNNEVDATVTTPLHKEALHNAGHYFDGHTEIYAHFTNTKKYAMMLADEDLRIIHVSTHVSLREACDRVKKNRIIEVTELIVNACRQMGIQSPRIAVAGLNPHASDGGLFGKEEEKEISPAVKELCDRGFHVDGPLPPDTIFAKARCGQYDACVAMYHDQGHIPFKVAGFQWDRKTGKMTGAKGVNITLGLPIIRVSVDHGTAFDIAWKGLASPDGLLTAFEYATKMARNKLH